MVDAVYLLNCCHTVPSSIDDIPVYTYTDTNIELLHYTVWEIALIRQQSVLVLAEHQRLTSQTVRDMIKHTPNQSTADGAQLSQGYILFKSGLQYMTSRLHPNKLPSWTRILDIMTHCCLMIVVQSF